MSVTPDPDAATPGTPARWPRCVPEQPTAASRETGGRAHQQCADERGRDAVIQNDRAGRQQRQPDHRVGWWQVHRGPALVGLVLARGRRTLKARLRLAEQQVRLLAEATEAMPWECDADGRITSAGGMLTELFGYSREELVGMTLRDIVHPREFSRLAGSLATGGGWRHERWRCVMKDGSEQWYGGSAAPSLAADGTLLGFTGTTHRLGKDALDEQHLRDVASTIYERLASGDIVPVFQPILSVATGRLVGAEALSRFPASDRTPEQWFTDAAAVGLSVELELAALRCSFVAARRLPEDIYVSVNVGPLTFVRPALLEVIATSGIDPSRLVLEVTEHASITDYDDICVASRALRALGVRIAVDDAGAGYASFRHILRLAPEVIKLDRSLVAGIDHDPARRALAAAVVMFGVEMGATITAEGVETPAELRCAQNLGINAAQGYLFGRPTGDWTTWNEWHQRGPLYSVNAATAAARSSSDPGRGR